MHGQTTLKFDNCVHNVPQQVPVFVIRINSTLLCHTLCIRVHQIVLFIFTIQNNQGMNNKHKPPLTTKNQSGYMRKWFLKFCKAPCQATLSICRSPDSYWVRLESSCCFWSVRLRFKRDGKRAETWFHLSAKRTSPFKSVGASVQSTTGSRSVRISGSNAGYTMFRGSVKSIGYPLHSPVSPSLSLPCVTVCHHISTGVYYTRPPLIIDGMKRNARRWEK